ncbi:ribonuclease Z [Candidatus Pacearchaeota archaeon]|jgi:ribonuclease Z|nr:ribonuclease Z [Candidatus Pacearchaeota archaeon]|tara:strand:+ start:6202 stop:7116 length:915 start_codon:yes stop_codon:yes gene_type:complete
MVEKIKVTFLGTSDSIPSANRNHTSIWLKYKDENILIDCGEGTQRQIRKAKLNPGKITKILLTHWHGDHILGIPGLLQTLALSKHNKSLTIYGPYGTKKFMESLFNTFIFVKKFPINIIEVKKEGKFFETSDFRLESKKMTHGPPCNAYAFIKKGKIRIDKKKLKKSKLPLGPLIKKLKQGKDITYNKKKYLVKNLTFKEEDKKVSIVLDTSINKKIMPFVKNSDLLICESNYAQDLTSLAKDYNHMTSIQAANIAKKSNSKKLILTHISQRYKKNLKKFLNDTKKVFKNSSLADDLDVVEISK